MSFLKRFIKFIIFMIIILVPFNYFFAHFSFNRVLNDYVQPHLIKGQTLSFKSSFHFYPSPSIYINNINYNDIKGAELTIKSLKSFIDLTSLIKQRIFLIENLTLDSLQLRLPKEGFDELLKSIMFPLIREGLGVPRDPANHLPSQFLMKNITLERTNGGDNAETFNISSIKYSTKEKNFMKVCFASIEKVNAFHQQFIAQYFIVVKVIDKCLVFTKSLKPLVIPKNLTSQPTKQIP